MSDSTTNLDLVIQSQSAKEVTINALADACSPSSVYGRRQSTSSGLTWGFYGGRVIIAGIPTAIANGTLTLTASSTNYIVALRSTGAVNFSTTTTNWNDPLYVRLYEAVTDTTNVTSYTDHRALSMMDSTLTTIVGMLKGLGGSIVLAEAGVDYANPGKPQNVQSVDYTTVLADANKHLLHPSADTTARTFTIDANATVAYPIGTEITFVNQDLAGVLTIAITTDTMRLAGAGTTGSRTLAANGIATALKITATEWIISGTNLT